MCYCIDKNLFQSRISVDCKSKSKAFELMGYPKLECRTEKYEYHKNESEYDELKAEYEETEHIKDNLYPGYFVLEEIIKLLIIKKIFN